MGNPSSTSCAVPREKWDPRYEHAYRASGLIKLADTVRACREGVRGSCARLMTADEQTQAYQSYIQGWEQQKVDYDQQAIGVLRSVKWALLPLFALVSSSTSQTSRATGLLQYGWVGALALVGAGLSYLLSAKFANESIKNRFDSQLAQKGFLVLPQVTISSNSQTLDPEYDAPPNPWPETNPNPYLPPTQQDSEEEASDPLFRNLPGFYPVAPPTIPNTTSSGNKQPPQQCIDDCIESLKTYVTGMGNRYTPKIKENIVRLCTKECMGMTSHGGNEAAADILGRGYQLVFP